MYRKRKTENFDDYYSLVKHIGAGGYGSVWSCLEEETQQMCAVKIVSDSKCSRKTMCRRTKKPIPEEVDLWRPLYHPNLVMFQELFYDASHSNWMYVMDYDEQYLDLFNFIDINGVMSSSLASAVIRQVVDVVQYLFDVGIDHRDIKDENILINPTTNMIKLFDFGAASNLSGESYSSYRGTDVYLPPEYYNQHSYEAGPAAVWAIGCLTHCLIAGDCPFEDTTEIAEFVKLQWLDKADEAAKHFIDQCLHRDPSRRPYINELLGHRWFNENS